MTIFHFSEEGGVLGHGGPEVSSHKFCNKILLINCDFFLFLLFVFFFFGGGGHGRPGVSCHNSWNKMSSTIVFFFFGGGGMQRRQGVSSLKFWNKISFISFLGGD